MAKLHQVIAIEKSIKTRVMRFITQTYHEFQKPQLFEGQTRTYERRDEDGDTFPDEQQLVQRSVEQMLTEVAQQATEYYDMVARKDRANCDARVNVMLDGNVLLQDVPATHLLFLEKCLVDLNTAIDSLPTLDLAHRWEQDPAGGYRSGVVQTQKTKKVPEVIRLAAATEHHAEQAQLVPTDKIIGHWNTVKQSGAVAALRKKQLQRRAQDLLKAIKFAREEANTVKAPRCTTGQPIFDYLLAE